MYDESSLSLPVSLYVIIYGMRWLRLVGSCKLYVSFAEYRLFYRALLQNIDDVTSSVDIMSVDYAGHDPVDYKIWGGYN